MMSQPMHSRSVAVFPDIVPDVSVQDLHNSRHVSSVCGGCVNSESEKLGYIIVVSQFIHYSSNVSTFLFGFLCNELRIGIFSVFFWFANGKEFI